MLTMVQSRGPNSLFYDKYSPVPAPFVEKIILSPFNYLGTLAKKQVTINVRGLFLDSQLYSTELNIYPFASTTCSSMNFLRN